jgi:PfaD family protein
MDLSRIRSVVVVSEEEGVCRVALNRPEADNALDTVMVRELTEVVRRAIASPSVTVLVLEGLPTVFCSGADFGVIADAARTGSDTVSDPAEFFKLLRLLSLGEILTIACVRGRTNAGGVGLVAACDVVVADNGATFGLSELLFGLLPAVVLPFLVRRVGRQRANYLTLTATSVTADRAAEWGLVDDVGIDVERVLQRHLQRARRLSASALSRYKSYMADQFPILDDTEQRALAANRASFGDPDNVDAIRRFSESGVFPWERERVASSSVIGLQPGVLPPAAALGGLRQADSSGGGTFREVYGLRADYMAGAMYRGISSADLVVALAQDRLMASFGSGGLSPDEIDEAVGRIRERLPQGESFAVGLLHSPETPGDEEAVVRSAIRHDAGAVEASAFTAPTDALVLYRALGLSGPTSAPVGRGHHIIAKVSRVEVARRFLSPAPPEIVARLLDRGLISPAQAAAVADVPLATDICAEADSAGHTDGRNPLVLLPSILRARDEAGLAECSRRVRVGAAGGIGTPAAVDAAFAFGVDFVVTGSVNQCTVEAGTSDAVKDILQGLRPTDTGYAPAGDGFESGARVQVVTKGNFFRARAERLYEIYVSHGSLEDLAPDVRGLLEQRWFRRELGSIWGETRDYLERRRPEALREIEDNPKRRLGQVLRWYFMYSSRLAREGDTGRAVDFQIHCGPAMGAFNESVAGTGLDDRRARTVCAVADHLLSGSCGGLTPESPSR